MLTLLGEPQERRDAGLSEAAREMVVASITGAPVSAADAGHRSAAAAMRAHLDQTSVLTGGERHLLEELLGRIANDGARGTA